MGGRTVAGRHVSVALVQWQEDEVVCGLGGGRRGAILAAARAMCFNTLNPVRLLVLRDDKVSPRYPERRRAYLEPIWPFGPKSKALDLEAFAVCASAFVVSRLVAFLREGTVSWRSVSVKRR